MTKKQIQKNKKAIKRTNGNENIENLLKKQTAAILDIMDKRFQEVDRKFDVMDKRFETVNKRFEEMEAKESQRFNRIMANFDKLLKRTVDTDEEIEFIKFDINRIKEVVKEKLGVNLM